MEAIMRGLLLVCMAVVLMAIAGSSRAESIAISIDEIAQDVAISGRVTGVDQTTAPHYRVAVYVHTDIWYIHPYAGQSKGKSWAAVAPNGDWSIEMIKREYV